MVRIAACALLALGLGCAGSRKGQQPPPAPLSPQSDFILKSTHDFFAKPDAEDKPLVPN
jgi:hypothetical protein